MHPAENISTLQLYLKSDLELKTSGATYPGVPHFGNRYLKSFIIINTYLKVQKLLIQNPQELMMYNHSF